MPARLQTKSQINRLGGKLRAGPITDDLLAQLQEFRSRYAAPMLKVQAVLSDELRLETTARLKTVNTTVEKLRRDKTRLSEVQDIGGVRLVGDWTLQDQDRIVAQIGELFRGARVVDRRARPSHGYRAVHVIVVVDGCAIEVQVRTLEQDGWAQSMEKLADILGRKIRYGGGGEENKLLIDAMTAASAGIARYESIRDTVQQAREIIAAAEQALADAAQKPLPGDAGEELRKRIEDLNLPELERREKAMAERVRKMLTVMAEDLDAMLTGGSDE